MARDHYVSQVHLRNFYSPALGGTKMFALRKQDLKQFPCGSADVCCIEDGSTNVYLEEQRAVESLLRSIEPRYNSSVAKLRDGNIDADAVYVVSSFVSYVLVCSPAAMRIYSEPLRRLVEAEAACHDNAGNFPPAPPLLGGRTVSELIADGVVDIAIDGKYPQAIGVNGIISHIDIFGNSDWEILINNVVGSPFFTSDFPIAIEKTSDPAVVNRIIPLAPDLAIRIRPTMNGERIKGGLAFPHFRGRRIVLGRGETRIINELIVRSAENLVFFRDSLDWVLPFVRKHAGYRIEARTDRVPAEAGYYLISRLKIERTGEDV